MMEHHIDRYRVSALVLGAALLFAAAPSSRLMSAVAESDGYLLDAGKFYVSATTGPSTVRGLYGAGAWFVWPIIGKGCRRR